MSMRGIYTSVNDIRKRVFAEVARLSYNYQDGDLSEMELIPYRVIPGEVSTYRESVFLERAIVKERMRLAMGLPLRDVTIGVHAVTLCIVLFVARDMFGFGSLCNIFLVGCAHDFFEWALPDLIPRDPEIGLKIALFIPFMALFILAVSAYVAADLGTSPYDAAPIIIHRKLTAGGRKVSSVAVRIAWDLLFTLVGLALRGPAGAVTAACVVFLGPLIQRISALMKRFVG